jgi:transcriptional antiterminator RfaH
VALHFLKLGGFETYCPRLREQRRHHGRKIITRPPLFPGYTFVMILAGWWSARWSPGVVRLIMDGEQPAHVPDAIISEIRSRERGGP